MPKLSTTKTCSKCGLSKPIDQFSKDKYKKDGYVNWCKLCKRNRDKVYRDNHLDEARAKDKKRWQVRKDEHNIKRREYRRRNKDKIAKQNAIYKKVNKERIKKRDTEYRCTPKGYANRLYAGLNRRTINGLYPRWTNKSCRRYLLKGVELRLTRDELYEFVLANWDIILSIWAAGGIPSIDRIGPSIHYELGNIQFIPLSENSRKAGSKQSNFKGECYE